MNEYKKKLAAMQAGQLNKESTAQPQTPVTNGIPNSALLDVFEGKTHATSEMMGRRVNLAESIQAKMTQAFGMDFSNLQLYRSDAMAGTGMHGMAQGNKVVLSSDVDLNTTEGQAVLGHELSHINAQRQGIGTGRGGLYNNAALEHQADVEGMRAAQGRPIYFDGMSYSDGMKYGLGMRGVEGLAPMSPGLGATAAAPMQAMKDDNRKVNKGLLGPEKMSMSKIGSSLKKKFASFTPKGRRQQLNDGITQQLAAFGITVTDDPVQPLETTMKPVKAPVEQAPRNPGIGKQPRLSSPQPVNKMLVQPPVVRQPLNQPKVTVPGLPKQPVVNDPNHNLLPSKEALIGGGKTTTGVSKNNKFVDINHVSPEQMLMGRDKNAPGWFSTSPIFDEEPKLPSKQMLDGFSKATNGWFSQSPIFDEEPKLPSKENVVGILGPKPVGPKNSKPVPVNINQNTLTQTPKGSTKTTTGVSGNKKFVDINRRSPEEMLMTGPKTISGETKNTKPVPFDINQNEFAQTPKSSTKTTTGGSNDKKKKQKVPFDPNKL